jgi:hypothetical protein
MIENYTADGVKLNGSSSYKIVNFYGGNLRINREVKYNQSVLRFYNIGEDTPLITFKFRDLPELRRLITALEKLEVDFEEKITENLIKNRNNDKIL